MKRWIALLVFVLGLFLVSGCHSPKLADGKYAANLVGREDCIYIYGDYIFLWIKDPRNETGTSYWFWGGKFKLDDGFQLRMDMDREMAREWNFYYNFFMQSGAIAVADLSRNQGYDMKLVPPNASSPAAPPAMQNVPEQRSSGVYQ